MSKCLIVVDYQNDFVSEDGTLGCKEARDIEQNIANKIIQYHSNGDLVIFTKDVHDECDYFTTTEGKYLPIMHCADGEWGSELYGEVRNLFDPEIDELLYKQTFGCGDLFYFLENNDQITEIEFAGVVSYICVLSNIVVARTALRNVEITVCKDCIAGPDKELHENCLKILEHGLQVHVL